MGAGITMSIPMNGGVPVDYAMDSPDLGDFQGLQDYQGSQDYPDVTE